MVKRWVVRGGTTKATYLRKEPVQETAPHNVIATVKKGDIVTGEFLLVRRASRESGFVKVKHLEDLQSTSWRIRNVEGSATTILRKHPQEPTDAGNTVGFANEGELVEGEFLWGHKQDERKGGYIKLRHLKPIKDGIDSGGPDPAVVAALLKAPPRFQSWAVMDAGHDGAWLRKAPSSDRSETNIVCLVPNGAIVAGEHLFLRRSSGESGYIRFRDLEQQGPKQWIVRCSKGQKEVPLRRKPPPFEQEADSRDDASCKVPDGEQLEGEFVFVSYKNGKKVGFIKRIYLTAMAVAKDSAKGSPPVVS